MPLHAVITGDIVNSTLLNGKAEKKLKNKLHLLLQPYKFEFYRSDSFQVYIKNIEDALQVALLCRTAAVATETKEKKRSCDIRVSIGIGKVVIPVRTLASARGEAFIASGRAFDMLGQTNKRLAIAIAGKAQASLIYSFDLLANYLDSLYRGMSVKKAELLFELLSRNSQQDAVKSLKKSKSSISQIANSAKWPEFEWLFSMYHKIITEVK